MRVIKFALIVVLVSAAFGAGLLLRRHEPAAPRPAGRTVLHYVDPMHPSYTSDKPGIAPDCGMPLEPVYADAEPSSGGNAALYYRDPSDASYTSTTAGTNPRTGKTLVPVFADAAATPAHPGAVHIPPARQQLAGVRFATVEMTDVGRTLRTVGKVTYDETRVQHVHTRVDGWIERVIVDFTGQMVRKGQPMLTIYSPELLASQEELLLARRARDTMKTSPVEGAAGQGESLFQAARRRLQLWNLTDAQVEHVLATGAPIRDVTLYAPATGFVLQRNAFPHQRVTDASDLYTLADLGTVWVMADVYEADLALIRPGAAARVVLPQAAGSVIHAKVDYVQPSIDPVTRTLQVRLEVRNHGLRLRPEMFVDVEFDIAGGRKLTVPADAVLDTGTRRVVFVDLGDGYLAPRDVQVGERTADRVAITSGLAEGDTVVASGTFLVDAESRLKAAIDGMGSPTTEPPAAAPAHGGHVHD